MGMSYQKLWRLLLDRRMKKSELARLAGISDFTLRKLNHDEDVSTAVLGRICRALDCTLDDICEFKAGVNAEKLPESDSLRG